MSNDQLDLLLAEALENGEIPVRATAAERAELERLLAIAGSVSNQRQPLRAEADAALPAARARFERFAMAGAQAPVAAAKRPAWWRIAISHRGLALAGSAAAAVALFIAAVFAFQSLHGVDTASALVLNENDYAQVQGIVSGATGEGSDRTFTLDSGFGPLEVSLSEATSVGGDAVIKLGDSLSVSGTVTRHKEATAIAATTVSVVPKPEGASQAAKPLLLRKLKADLEGQVVLLTVSRDGGSARVVLQLADGQQVAVAITADSVGNLLHGSAPVIGQRIRIARESVTNEGEFAVSLAGDPPLPGVQDTLAPIRGVLLSRAGNILRIQTNRGVATVIIQRQTRIVAPDASGLTVATFHKGERAIGHEVAVQGSVDRATGRVTADVLWVGPMAPAR